jgi:hypothetical protein
MSRRCPRSTTVQPLPRSPALPTRRRATASMGRWVAERPIRTGGRSESAASRSSVSARWAPRLSRATAWISSTIAVRTERSVSRLFPAVTIR